MRWSSAALLAVSACSLCGCPDSPRPDSSLDRSIGGEPVPSTERGPADQTPPADRRAADLRPPDPNKTFWVSPTGAAAWTVCKGLTPLAGASACSLATASTNAAAGDTVNLRAGTYGAALAPAKSGTSTERIVFRSHAGERAKIGGVATGLSLAGRSYVTVDGVDVEGCKTFADLQTADHVWILNGSLTSSSDTGGWPMGIRMYNNSRYNRLAGCTVGRSGYQTASDDIGGVMNLGNWENPTDTTSHNLIENNTFYHGGHHILEIASRNNIVRNNTFHNENWTSCPRPSTGNLCGNRGAALYREQRDGTFNVIEGNRFAFAGASIDDQTGASGLSVRSPQTIVRRNLFYLNDGPGLHLYVDSTKSYEASSSHLYHNVFFKNGLSPLNASTVRATFGLLFENSAGNSAPIPIVGVSVKNNLFHGDLGGAIFFYYTDPAKQTVLGNFWKSVSGSNAGGFFTPVLPAGNVVSAADPLFADVSAAPTVANLAKLDFHLRAGSPAINHGAFLTTATAAGSGTSMVVADAAYFIDGFGVIEGDLIQLEGQTQTARIVGVDYAANRLTLDTALTWKAGQGIALPYAGTAPDIGAYEAP